VLAWPRYNSAQMPRPSLGYGEALRRTAILQALKEWLTGAWRYLAQPSLTRYERREVRNMMKQVQVLHNPKWEWLIRPSSQL
jgi:hypothetical protein